MAHVFEPGEDHFERCAAMLHAAGTNMKTGDKCDEPDEGSDGENKYDARALKPGSGEEMREREGKEQAADCRPGDVGDLKDGSAPGDGIDEVLLRDEVRHQCRTCRAGEGAPGADDKKDRVNYQNILRATDGVHGQHDAGKALKGVASQNDVSPVKSIGDVARREQEEESGKKEGQPRVTEVDGAMRDGVDLPGDGDGLRFSAENGNDSS